MSKVTLDEWAAAEFKTPPSPNTLRKWAREGRISPRPVKHGRSYYVDSEARYQEPAKLSVRSAGGSLLSRIERARHGAEAA
ncbi:excisionase [Pseudomonas fluorescens]|uniref:excisionase n=1 Tax=Pseudomonas fluorescens TaxID=294 RepID=UPI0009BB4695|nr:excisionase [Pseudomonas fluorescens]